MSILNEAIKKFREQNYAEAIQLFERAASIYGQKVVDANIQLCKKALASAQPNNQTLAADSTPFVNEYFDKIYLVNLRHDAKRRLSSTLHLRNNKIKFTLHEATNGYEGDALKTYHAYMKRPLGQFVRYPEFKDREIQRGKPFIESAGAIGYIYTYLSILQDAKAKGHKRILILEDDVLLDNRFHEKFAAFLSVVPEDWKVLQLGASQYNWKSVNEDNALNDGYYHPRRLDTCGSFAIALDHSIFDELIEAESAFESPFDHLSMGEIYERHLGRCFVCYPNIVMPDVGSSSIRNGRNQRTHAANMRWPIENFSYPLPTPSIAIFIHNQHNIKYLDRFDPSEKLPFSPRIYLYTEDGPRPVHSRDIFNKENYQPAKLPSEVQLPRTDFVTKLTPQAVLSENEILEYLDSQLLDLENKTSLINIKNNPPVEVPGKVSVVIPTYKRPLNLEKAIKSVISQNYPVKEIIVISDNGAESEANKETKKIIEEIKTQTPSIELHLLEHKFNRNGAAARNTGLLKATGEYVCFLDDDDIYLQNRIQGAVFKLNTLPQTVGAVYCGFVGWNSPNNDESRYKSGDLTRELLLLEYKSHYLHTNTATYRRSALIHINGFDETYRRHQDIEINLRFFNHFTIDYVKEAGVRLNPEPSEISNKIFNSAMLDLKQKFLTQFSYIIRRFDQETQFNIYKKHWDEVSKYTTDVDSTKMYLNSLITNGPLQLSLTLSREKE